MNPNPAQKACAAVSKESARATACTKAGDETGQASTALASKPPDKPGTAWVYKKFCRRTAHTVGRKGPEGAAEMARSVSQNCFLQKARNDLEEPQRWHGVCRKTAY